MEEMDKRQDGAEQVGETLAQLEQGEGQNGGRRKYENNQETLEDPEEDAHFRKVVLAFREYLPHSLKYCALKKRHWEDLLSESQKAVVRPMLLRKMGFILSALKANGKFISSILEPHGLFQGARKIMPEESASTPADGSTNQNGGNAEKDQDTIIVESKESDMDKVRSVLRQFSRDWSAEGKPERDICYGLLLNELTEHYPNPIKENGDQVRVLIPGCGLGRLPWEVARRGFCSQGNEFSYFMLIPSNFVLNRTSGNTFTIYPYVHAWNNVLNTEDQLRAVQIPDVDTAQLPPEADFSMAAGDFLEVYSDASQEGKWDVILTCFFVDTANNVMDYVEVIHKALKPDGLWINIGPLLYHFFDMAGEKSVELNYQEMSAVIRAYGFEILKEKMVRTTYAHTLNSLMEVVYNCVFFSARKNSGELQGLCTKPTYTFKKEDKADCSTHTHHHEDGSTHAHHHEH